ncbi:MAG TPA: prepilin-type N-terminal cleavage/methylation domain-containing protein [Gemmatimonadales bacterium]|nr:prepilin-type N-terminal cleavage/methylation domain-containing protein [Gemmatimonadales bacterium]
MESVDNRRGFTLVEAAVVIVIFSILTAIMLPKVTPTVARVSATRAANIVAQDLEQGFTLAQRTGAPILLTGVPGQTGYTLTDRATGKVYSSRSFARGNGLAVDSVQISPSPVTIFPSGYADAAATVTLWSRGSVRTITATRTGVVTLP